MNLSTKILRRIHESISKAREDYNQKFEARFGYTSATEEAARRHGVEAEPDKRWQRYFESKS